MAQPTAGHHFWKTLQPENGLGEKAGTCREHTAHTEQMSLLRGHRELGKGPWARAGSTAGSDHDSYPVSWMLDVLQGTVVSAKESSGTTASGILPPFPAEGKLELRSSLSGYAAGEAEAG